MLNKQICIRCINKHRYEPWDYNDNYNDNDNWINRVVICPSRYSNTTISLIDNNPQIKCPYALEHIISMESKINVK